MRGGGANTSISSYVCGRETGSPINGGIQRKDTQPGGAGGNHSTHS